MDTDEIVDALGSWIAREHRGAGLRLIGLNGAQGSGKSTLARQLTAHLSARHKLRTAVLALDDLYLTRAERRRLAVDVHPLLATRGVPGTHDVALGLELLSRLPALGKGETLQIPRFLKVADDRAPRNGWTTLTGPFDLLLFEGWCVGTPPQSEPMLQMPVNALETQADADERWRHWVNAQLAGPYQRLFAPLQRLIFLQAPDFDCVLAWRLQQEHTDNAEAANTSAGQLMDKSTLRRFIAHYERLTRHALATLPHIAEAVVELTPQRGVRTLRLKPDD